MHDEVNLDEFLDAEAIARLDEISRLVYEPDRLNCEVFAGLAFEEIKRLYPGNTYFISLAADIIDPAIQKKLRKEGRLGIFSTTLPHEQFERHSLVAFNVNTIQGPKQIWVEPQTRAAWFGEYASDKVYKPWAQERMVELNGSAELVAIQYDKVPKNAAQRLNQYLRRT